MDLYSIINFSHIVGSIGVLIAISFERLMMMKLLNSKNPEQFIIWKNLRAPISKIGTLSLVVSLLTGVYLSATAWPEAGWVWPSILALVLTAAVGAWLTGASQKIIDDAISAREVGPAWGKLWVSLQIRTGLLIGITFIMVTKPSFEKSIAALAFWMVIFTIPVAFFWRKYKPLRTRAG